MRRGKNMAEFSTDLRLSGAFIFNGKAVIALYESIKKFVGEEPNVTIEFEGGNKIHGNDAKLLMDDPYITTRPIVNLSIDGRTSYQAEIRRSASISLSSEYSFQASSSIRGDRDGSLLLRHEIEEICKGSAAWFSNLYLPTGNNYDATRIAFGFLVCWVIAFFAVAYTLSQSVSVLKIDLWFLFQRAVDGVILLWIWLFLNRRLFPRILFDIGKSSERVKSAQHWRSTVFGGFILAVIAGIVATIITDRFKR
jgi:hypothetical protein